MFVLSTSGVLLSLKSDLNFSGPEISLPLIEYSLKYTFSSFNISCFCENALLFKYFCGLFFISSLASLALFSAWLAGIMLLCNNRIRTVKTIMVNTVIIIVHMILFVNSFLISLIIDCSIGIQFPKQFEDNYQDSQLMTIYF